jgi:hypothetical protein
MPSTILLYGNCQAENLAQIGRFLPSLREAVSFKVIPTHLVTAEDWRGRFDQAFTADVDVLWEQVETGEPDEHRQQLRSRVRPEWQVLRFPPYSMLTLWPLAGHDPRLAEALPHRYPWPDSVAAAVAQEGLQDDDAAFERYMQLSTDRMPDLDRRLRMDIGRWRATDELADIKETDWVLETFRDRQIFYTAGHVSALPLGRMMKQLLERTTLLTSQQIWQARLEVDLLLRRHRGQDLEVVPVHPLVAERMGLRYYDTEARHRWHGHEWTFREYTLNYIRWAPFLEG